METLRMNQKEMLEIETVAGIKNGSDRLISRLNTTKEGISDLEYKVIETSQTEGQSYKSENAREHKRIVG